MNFISNSQDVLFLVLAFCALWLTVFLVWFLYYAIMTVKQTYQTVHQIKAKVEAVDEIIRFVKDKVTSTASYLTLIISAVRKIIDLLGGDDKEKKAKRKK